MKLIAFSDLVHMDGHNGLYMVDVVYADAMHPENVFGCALYRKDAKMYLHRRMAAIVIEAAKLAKVDGYILHLKDGLRPMEAQAAMSESPAARAHPEWLEEPRLISPPGQGGHPRGMAVDVTLFSPERGCDIDMGTPFDEFPADKNAGLWPAHRHYTDFPQAVLDNRKRLDSYMLGAADTYDEALLPLPAEWWDYRFYPDEIRQYEPLSDKDLPDHIQIAL